MFIRNIDSWDIQLLEEELKFIVSHPANPLEDLVGCPMNLFDSARASRIPAIVSKAIFEGTEKVPKKGGTAIRVRYTLQRAGSRGENLAASFDLNSSGGGITIKGVPNHKKVYVEKILAEMRKKERANEREKTIPVLLK